MDLLSVHLLRSFYCSGKTYNFRHRQILQKELRITTKIRRGQRTKALITKMISPALAEIVCKSHLEHDNLK